MSKNMHKYWIWLFVVLFFLGLLLYIVSGTTVNVISDDGAAAHAEKKRLAEVRLKLLQEKMEAQKAKKEKLEKWFTITFALFRIALFGMYLLLNWLIWWIFDIKSFKDLLDINEKVLICFGILLFFIGGVEINLFKYFGYCKVLIKNKVYGKYINIDIEMQDDKNEIKKLETFIQEPAPVNPIIIDNKTQK